MGTLSTGSEDVFIKVHIDPVFRVDYDTSSTGSRVSIDALAYVSDTVLADIKNEVKIIRSLMHDHIVLYYNEIDTNGIYGYSMEYCKGGTLHHYIRTMGALSEEELKILMRQMLSALEYLASRHIVHRDIKTANILIVKKDYYKLGDFGSSVELNVNVLGVTNS